MDRRRRNIVIAIGFSLTIMISMTLFLIVDSRFLDVGWIDDAGALANISDIYTSNDNISYSVSFHGVNFTFMHWNYPKSNPPDQLYTAYFLIEFVDNSSQVLYILTGSFWLASGSISLPLTAEATVGTSPIAGVLYHGYMDRPVGWRFFVGMF
jgi:hypothetical protein